MGASRVHDLPPGSLDRLLRAALKDETARFAWEHTGLLTRSHLVAYWGKALPTPVRLFLRSGRDWETGRALQVEIATDDLAEASARILDAFGSDALTQERPARTASPTAPETVPPSPARGSTGGDPDDGPFALYGMIVSPEDQHERVDLEDLAWIVPGDRLTAPQGVRYRVEAVEGDAEQFLLRDAQGERRVLTADEILAGYCFVD